MFSRCRPLQFNHLYLWLSWFWLKQLRYSSDIAEDDSVFLLYVEVQEAVEDRVGAGRGHSNQVADQLADHHVF